MGIFGDISVVPKGHQAVLDMQSDEAEIVRVIWFDGSTPELAIRTTQHPINERQRISTDPDIAVIAIHVNRPRASQHSALMDHIVVRRKLIAVEPLRQTGSEAAGDRVFRHGVASDERAKFERRTGVFLARRP